MTAQSGSDTAPTAEVEAAMRPRHRAQRSFSRPALPAWRTRRCPRLIVHLPFPPRIGFLPAWSTADRGTHQRRSPHPRDPKARGILASLLARGRSGELCLCVPFPRPPRRPLFPSPPNVASIAGSRSVPQWVPAAAEAGRRIRLEARHLVLKVGLSDEERADRRAGVSLTGGQGLVYLRIADVKRGLLGGLGLARHVSSPALISSYGFHENKKRTSHEI